MCPVLLLLFVFVFVLSLRWLQPLAAVAMEGLYFEVKPRGDRAPRPGTSERATPLPVFNQQSASSPAHLRSQGLSKIPSVGKNVGTWQEKVEDDLEEVRYKLTLMGSLPVHHLTTMAMLPWVVAEISHLQPSERDPVARLEGGEPGGGQLDSSSTSRTVFLCVSASSVRCVSVLEEADVWDPLTHREMFQCRPHQVTKLIRNSQEPRSFGCLVKDSSHCGCYVFRCQDSTKVSVCIRLCEECGRTTQAFHNEGQVGP